MSEKQTHIAVINYLKLAYPKILFRSDTGAGMRLTIGQAKAQKAIQNGQAWPDLFIAEPMMGCSGMFLELKDSGVILFNKKGNAVSDHIKKQGECLLELQKRGYLAFFATGFDQAKELIDIYLDKCSRT